MATTFSCARPASPVEIRFPEAAVAEQHDEAGAAAAPPGGAPSPGFEHLGWQPSWRDRVEGVLTSASPGRLAAGAAAAVVVVVVSAAVLLRGPAPPPPELALPLAGAAGDPASSSTTLGSTTSSTAATEVVVHAAGAVARPGVYRLAAGARVSDLLDAAGGPVPGADLDRLNLAAPLVDGERVFVPLPGQEVPAVSPSLGGGGRDPGRAGGGAPRPEAPLDLNRATLDELDELPGVGPSTAQAIVDERDRRGGFTAVDQLLEVRGIGDAKLAALRELVRV